MEALIQERNKELGGVFDSDAQQRNQLRSKHQREMERKKDVFFNELIKLVIFDEEGKIVPGCEWLITRKKLTVRTIEGQIKRSPLPKVRVDFFYTKDGIAISPEELPLKAQVPPEYYIIVPKTTRIVFDIRKDPKFEGQTTLMLVNVPLTAKDEKTKVDEFILREWILFGLVEEDPYAKKIVAEIEEVKVVIKEIDKRVKAVPKLEFFNDDGSKMKTEDAEVQRQALFDAYGNDRLAAESRLKTKETNLKLHIEWRRCMKIDISMGEIDENTRTANWFVKMSGLEDVDLMEELLVKKDDWPGIRLACGSPENGWPIWVGRGGVPAGGESYAADYTMLQVNILGANFRRIPHGVGTLKQLDRQSTAIKSEKFELYYGGWDVGKKFGFGLEFTDTGVYYGRFVGGNRQGHGKLDLGDGTTIVGNFGTNEVRGDRFPSTEEKFQNPYREGEPNGHVEILFGDGGVYRGNIKDGVINGPGEYQSGLGEVMIGTFKDGVLHGENGYHRNQAGEKIKGEFIDGELNGFGIYENENGHKYKGYYMYGLRHGRGRYSYGEKKGYFSGFYVLGSKTGRGQLVYGKVKKKKKSTQEEKEEKEKSLKKIKDEMMSNIINHKEEMKKNEEETLEEKLAKLEIPEPDFQYVFQAIFFANNLTGGGILMNTINQIPSIISRRNKRAMLTITKVLNKEQKVQKQIRRNQEKLADMELSIRNEMTEKKFIIFQQQKHFTKKTMYAESTIGSASVEELKARSIVRKDRFERLDEDKYVSKKALVPHLKFFNRNTEKGLTGVFSKIKVDPENGDVRKVKKILPRIAISDFEEMKERQRFLKYDLMWQRAEEAFANKKKSNTG